jgi:diguanylate cyclase (GGDEF)-like protein
MLVDPGLELCMTEFVAMARPPVARLLPAAGRPDAGASADSGALGRVGRLVGLAEWHWRPAAAELSLSAMARELLGLPLQPSLPQLLQRFGADGATMLGAALQRACTDGEGWDVELPCDPVGACETGPRVLRLFGDPDGAGNVCVVMQDVTETARVRAELEQALERLALATHSGGIGVWDIDLRASDLVWDDVMWQLHGEAPRGQAITLRGWRGRLQAGDRRQAARALREALAGGAQLDAEWRVCWPDGSLHVLRSSGRVLRDRRGRALRVSGVSWDVTQQRRQWDEIRHRASHDSLTGLVNRGEFEQRLVRSFERARRDGSRHALLALDLDRFKLVNDHCGHAAGDEVLRQVAQRLEAGVRGRDTVARLGGDEFAAILENCSLDEAARVAQKLCDAMEQYRFVQGGQSFRVGASIGVAPLDGRWPDADAALREADACCMVAKEQGRSRVQVWDPDNVTQRAHQSEHRWATRLQQALDEGRFELDLQRVLPAAGDDGGLRGELLLRLREPDGSRVLPGAFMAAAERFHLAPRIDRWVLRQAVALLQRDGETRFASLAVNVSALTLQDTAFHEEARGLLTALGPQRARALCLEITETAVITQLTPAATFIAQMRALGARVALDDFGAGASSFGYLKALPVDVLKIDGQFVRQLLSDRLDQVAVRSFIDVARTLGLTTVAECVETAEVLAELGRLGVDFVQGFLLHRPQPMGEVLAGLG